MREHTKEQAYDEVTQAIAKCTEKDSHFSAAVIIVDEEKDTVKVYGLNMDEMELPMLLIEAASEVGDKIDKLIKNRTLQ